MAGSTKGVQKKGVASAKQRFKDTSGENKNTGIYCGPMVEGFPEIIEGEGQTYDHGSNNTYICQGRDQPRDLKSGHGGAGETHCGMVKIVVGSQGVNAKDVDPSTGKKLYADPDPTKDAATVYISQTSDVDDNFKIAAGTAGKSKAKSCIVLKADDVRHVSRQGIKLVTGTDVNNSRDNEVSVHYGIDLIGGNNDSDMQAMVKAGNLVKALEELNLEIKKLNGTVAGFVQYQMQFNLATMFHFHITLFPLMPTLPDIFVLPALGAPANGQLGSRTFTSLASQKSRLATWKQNYLQPHGKAPGAAGRTYIGSSWHNLS